MSPVPAFEDTPELEVLETAIASIMPDRTSKNGNEYTALVLPSGDWVFVWDDHWRAEITDHLADYEGLDAKLYVRDKEDKPGNHFYQLEAVVPADPEQAGAFFERTRSEAEEPDAQPAAEADV